ncbi:MAG: hypothetical protein ACI3VQ_05675 [Faecousia sp.]
MQLSIDRAKERVIAGVIVSDCALECDSAVDSDFVFAFCVVLLKKYCATLKNIATFLKASIIIKLAGKTNSIPDYLIYCKEKYIMNTNEKAFISAAEIAETLGVSKNRSYEIVHALNAQLQQNGYIAPSRGATSRQYFYKKVYGSEQIRGCCSTGKEA